VSTVPTQLITAYAEGTGKLRADVAGLSREQMLATPIPGKWSMQTLVMHVADAENAFVDRIKRIIAMDNAVLLEWNEEDFVAKLHYDKQSIDDAILAFEAQRRNMTAILNALSPETFDRYGEHNKRGKWTLPFAIERAVWHLDHHLAFAHEKRKAMGK
jgi:uncharacterized damage-inducible protein DinB